jgi:ribonuclease HI
MEEKLLSIIIPNINSKVIHKPSPIYPKSDDVLYFDGCSKGNPGPSGIGAVLYKNNIEFWSDSRYIGNKRTNNEAEYCALIMGLEEAINCNIKNLSVCGDSLLVINQVNGVYKVKHVNLIPLYEKVMELIKHFKYINFTHVYRNENKRADKLSNIALELINREIYDNLVKDTSTSINDNNVVKQSFLPNINAKN